MPSAWRHWSEWVRQRAARVMGGPSPEWAEVEVGGPDDVAAEGWALYGAYPPGFSTAREWSVGVSVGGEAVQRVTEQITGVAGHRFVVRVRVYRRRVRTGRVRRLLAEADRIGLAGMPYEYHWGGDGASGLMVGARVGAVFKFADVVGPDVVVARGSLDVARLWELWECVRVA